MSILDDWSKPSLGLRPVKYHFTNEYWRDVFIDCRDFEKSAWCISLDGGSVLSKRRKAFIFERSPSNRTDADLRDTRFPSALAAHDFFMKHKVSIERAHHAHPKTKYKEATYGRRSG